MCQNSQALQYAHVLGQHPGQPSGWWMGTVQGVRVPNILYVRPGLVPPEESFRIFIGDAFRAARLETKPSSATAAGSLGSSHA